MESLVENPPNGEALKSSQVDNLSIDIHPSNVGEATVGCVFDVAHICVNQVRVRVASMHWPRKKGPINEYNQSNLSKVTDLKSMQGTPLSI